MKKKSLTILIPALAILAAGIFCVGFVETKPMTLEKLSRIILGDARNHYNGNDIVSRLDNLDELSKKTFGAQRLYYGSDSIVARLERLEKHGDSARASSKNEPNPRDLQNKITALERTVSNYDSTIKQLRSENRQLTQKLRDIERKIDTLERSRR